MSRFDLVGGSYQSQSVVADSQRTFNWYREVIESQTGKSASALYPCPGTAVFAQIQHGFGGGQYGEGGYGIGEIADSTRGLYYAPTSARSGRLFTVVDTALLEVLSNGTVSLLANVADDGLPVSMAASNPTTGQPGQLLIASAGVLYVLNLSKDTIQTIPASTFANGQVSQVGYIKGFFVATLRNSNFFYVSNALDATTWTDSAGISDFPDNIVSMLCDHGEMLVMSAKQAEFWYVSGGALFPMAAVPGSFIERGSGATYGLMRLDNLIAWIEQDENGGCMAFRLQGYSPTRISNHAIEFAWAQYARIDDAVGYAYQEYGHTFAVWYFPTADKTWVFDAATGEWHERGSVDDTTAPPTVHGHRSWCHSYAFGKHLVGDWGSGTIYELSSKYSTDAGKPLYRFRCAPHIAEEQERVSHSELVVIAETGLGPSLQGNAPATIFKISDPTGTIWDVGFEDNGKIVSRQPNTLFGTTVIPLTVFPLFITDQLGQFSFQLTIDTFGVINLLPVVFNSNYPQSVQMYSLTGNSKAFLQAQAQNANSAILVMQNVEMVKRGPSLGLKYSNDYGRTYFSRESLDAGQAGELGKRLVWRRLGVARDRVYMIWTSDPWPARIIDGYLKASPGFQPQERLAKQFAKQA